MSQDELKLEHIGQSLDLQASQRIKERIWTLMGRGFNISNFPGMQPVSFHINNINNIQEKDYYVCEKTDGIRVIGVMEYCGSVHGKPLGYFYISDRKYEFRAVIMAFPLDSDGRHFNHDTIIDAELVIDTETCGQVLSLYIFDIMVFQGKNIMNENLNYRFKQIQNGIKRPFDAFYSSHSQFTSNHIFRIRMKEMFKPYSISHLFSVTIPNLSHINDGLIFTSVDQPYIIGTCYSLLKWKEKDKNTADFKISIIWDAYRRQSYRLLISRNHIHEHYDWLTLDSDTRAKWATMNLEGRIIECNYDPNWDTWIDLNIEPKLRKGGWKFLRFRDDKTTANDINVLDRIIESIQNSPTKDELIALESNIRENWNLRHSFAS